MRDKDPPPEEFRCKRTDGRQWRCKRRALDGKTLCDIHYLQGKHRQQKQRVPDSLKLERNAGKRKGGCNGGAATGIRVTKLARVQLTEGRRRGSRVSEALDDVLKKMKLKRGDLQLELIRVFLKRQVEKRKEKELMENAVGNETRQLPYGVMAISQTASNVQKASENHGLDVKLGVEPCSNSFLQRHFRSKNIEPLPISTMQVVPFAGIVKKKKIKRCHWCRESKFSCLTKCLACRKRFYCVTCIKQRCFDKREVKLKCPACCGTCGCKLCLKFHYRPNNQKDCCRGERKLDRIQLLHYLTYKLLPVLKKINRDQGIELERESKVTGKRQSEIQIPQIKLDFCISQCCNKCKTSIVDYHRTCTNCSYNLCLGCCQELSQHSSYGCFKLRSCRKRKISPLGDQMLHKQNISKQNLGGLPYPSVIYKKDSEDGNIHCPPKEMGGCGDSILNLRCVVPFNWTRELEVKAEEMLCSYHFSDTPDVSSCCTLCSNIYTGNDEAKQPGQFSRRIGINDIYLYCPSVNDLHQETPVHFQSHWSKGHPVIVREVLRSTTALCWDPVSMFCAYMENKCSESSKEDVMKATNCLDWCEVEIDRKRIFVGSLEKKTHASVRQKFLRFKAWLSSGLFQKQFPVHYNEILNALPLPEYINPVSGLLNVGVKLSKEMPKPELGPCIYFSYGGPEELMQADYTSKLCYESHDTVNMLAYTTDAPISPEHLKKIEDSMKKYKARDLHNSQSYSNNSDQKGKSSFQSEDTGESGLQDIGENICLPNGFDNVPFCSSAPDKGETMHVENGNLSDDSESDAETSILLCGSIEKSEDSDFEGEDIESSCSSEDKQEIASCGAQWDIFPREDVPRLLEYLRRHSNEFGSACGYAQPVHHILDQNFFLDAYHKLKLKEEFGGSLYSLLLLRIHIFTTPYISLLSDIQPWTFEQHIGEAVFIPAGCPYQIRRIKSCVSVVLDFISPENATQCVQLNEEIRLLPIQHKAKRKVMEVEKMVLQGISTAIEDLCNLIPAEQAQSASIG